VVSKKLESGREEQEQEEGNLSSGHGANNDFVKHIGFLLSSYVHPHEGRLHVGQGHSAGKESERGEKG
jgi:hypothetical protein